MQGEFNGKDFIFEDINSQKCGCYVKNLKDTAKGKVALAPLKHIDYCVEITNALASVTLVQKYHNPTQQFLEIYYSFPIEPKSCVYRFLAEFGNVSIEGVVKEKQEAKKEYKEAVQEGRQAAYGEIDSQSSDIMNLQIGNIPPQTDLKITISYLQQLTIDYNMFYRFHTLSTISPRYMNNFTKEYFNKCLDSAKNIESNFTWNFTIEIKSTKKLVFFDNRTKDHQLEMTQQNQSCTVTNLRMTKKSIPNKDFVLLYTTEDFHLPICVLGRTDNSCTAMISFIPKFCNLPIGDAYKAMAASKPMQVDLNAVQGEYIFLLDRSASMSGSRIEKAKQALILFIQSLPQHTYFNIVSFGSNSSSMFNKSKAYDQKTLKEAVQSIKKMSADLGGTEIYGPLQNILKEKVNQAYPKQIFLLTDGAVSNTNGVIDLVSNNTKYARVHCIGIGNGSSAALIKGCAQKGKGYHIFIDDNENPSQKIILLLEQSLSPVISKVQLKYDTNNVKGIVPNPQSIPYILKNQIVNFYITFNKQLQSQQLFTFSYEDSQNKQLYSSDLQIDPNCASEPFIDKMGQKQIISNLQEVVRTKCNIQDHMYYAKKVEPKAEVIQLSVKSQILSNYTAFICIGKELKDGQLQQMKDKGQSKVHIKPIQTSESINKFQSNNQAWGMPNNLPIKLSSSSRQVQKSDDLLDCFCSLQNNISNKQLSPSRYVQKSKNLFDLCSQQNNIPDKLFDLCSQQNDQIEFDRMQKEIYRQLQEQKKAQKIRLKSKVEKESEDMIKSIDVTIQTVVSYQNINGSWDRVDLLHQICKSKQQTQAKFQEFGKDIVITYLVSEWIQKYHPSKQYTLIVKKAHTWIAKTIDLSKLTSLKQMLK